jgi:nucleoid-associated protein YgaU
MGLFSFLKTAGTKILGKKEEAPKDATTQAMEDLQAAQKKARQAALEAHVMSFGLSVENLSIDIEEDKATIHGQVDTNAEREKIILTVGNTEGISTVEDRIVVLNPEPEATFYTVVKGDSLSKIAKAHYGDAMKYPVIFEANKPMLTSPDLIYPGQVLRIPAL